MHKKQLLSLLLAVGLGVLIWFSPKPIDVKSDAWHLFAIFVATIFAVILKPMPMGAIAIVSMAVATITNTVPLNKALEGFQSTISWLVVFAFFISRGFIKTRLGERIAYYFVSSFGKKTLGLSYSLLASDLVLAPAIPSVTARAGGIIYPIVQGLARSFGSDPTLGTEKHIGSYLMKVCYQGSVITSAMFLTAMAANPLFVGLTQQAGFQLSWGTWAIAAIVPGLITIILLPLILYVIYPPEIKNTPHAPEIAKKKLEEMGKIQRSEIFMLGVFVCLVILWIFGSLIGISATMAALLGLSGLLLFSVLDWKDVINESSAWDTFIWFSILIMLATALNQLGFTPWFSEQVVKIVGGFHWLLAFCILFLIYFYSHYFFASNTAHVSALYPSFFMVAIGLGVPANLAILSFAFASNLFGGLTHYGSGPAPIYYGSGYIEIKDWWKLGFYLSVVNIIVWIVLGSLWWRVLGLWS